MEEHNSTIQSQGNEIPASALPRYHKFFFLAINDTLQGSKNHELNINVDSTPGQATPNILSSIPTLLGASDPLLTKLWNKYNALFNYVLNKYFIPRKLGNIKPSEFVQKSLSEFRNVVSRRYSIWSQKKLCANRCLTQHITSHLGGQQNLFCR